MARLRKFVAYRRLERPNTRVSKFKKHSFVKANPAHTIVRFDMGHQQKKFDYRLELVSKADLQIRHNAIESARQTSNRMLEKTLGNEYTLKVMIYPHHILRENPLAAGAGADRFSTGMAHSFGKPISKAARVKTGQTMFRLDVNKINIETAKKALQRAQYKIPCGCLIEISKNSAK